MLRGDDAQRQPPVGVQLLPQAEAVAALEVVDAGDAAGVRHALGRLDGAAALARVGLGERQRPGGVLAHDARSARRRRRAR